MPAGVVPSDVVPSDVVPLANRAATQQIAGRQGIDGQRVGQARHQPQGGRRGQCHGAAAVVAAEAVGAKTRLGSP